MAYEPAIPTGPIDKPPYDVIPAMLGEVGGADAIRRDLLGHALRGVEIGDWDRLIAEWIATACDNSTAVTVISWLERARIAGACDGDTKAVAS